MKKDIKIGERIVTMKATALTPIFYKEQFNRDLIRDMQAINKTKQLDFETISRLAWIFAKSADKSIPDMNEWLEGFEMFDVMLAGSDIVELYGLNSQTNSIPAKK